MSTLFLYLQKEKASKCFRKTRNYVYSADIMETMGKYDEAIQILLQENSHESIIKALECASKHKNKISACYQMERIARKHAQALARTLHLNDTDSVGYYKYLLKFLPASDQIDQLKAVKLFDETFEILLSIQNISDLYRLCKGQGWFDKALEVAEKQKDVITGTMFLLFKAAKEMKVQCLSESTKILLKNHCGLDTEIGNMCMLMYGMGTSDPVSLNSARTFFSENNIIAYLETLHISTTKLEYDSDEHICKEIWLKENEDQVMTILNACREIVTIKRALDNVQESNLVYIKHVESFFGFEKDPDGVYLVPESSYPWTNELLANNPDLNLFNRNPDNLLKVEATVALKAVCGRLEEFSNTWIAEDKLKVVEIYCKRLKSFYYHEQMITNSCHLQESYLEKVDKQTHLQAYLDILSSLFEMKELGNKHISFDVVEAVLNVLTPQATCYIQSLGPDVQHESSNHMSMFPLFILSPELNLALYNKVQATLISPDEALNINDWLELCRIQSFTKIGLWEIRKALKPCVERVNWYRYGGLEIPPFYVYKPQNNAYNHLILEWLYVCGNVKKKRVYSACTVCVYSVVCHIASQQLLWETISVSNLLNIVTVQLVAILTMLGICSIRTGNPANIYVPLSYFNIIRVFLGMVGAPNLVQSCFDDTLRDRKVNLFQLQNKVVHLLRIILQVVLGKYNIAFNLLKIVTSTKKCLFSHEAEHCLVFVLILMGNLGLFHNVSDTELYYFRCQICESIKCCKKPIIRQVYEIFSTSSELSGCFRAANIILKASKDHLECFSMRMSPFSNPVCDTRQAHLEDIVPRSITTVPENVMKGLKHEDEVFKLQPTAAQFVSSWIRSDLYIKNQSDQNVTRQDRIELDDDQDAILNDTTEDVSDRDHLMPNGDCSICACQPKPDTPKELQHDKDSSSVKMAVFLEHCRTDNHLQKKKEYYQFKSKMEEYKAQTTHLSELLKKCKCKCQLWQDNKLKNVIQDITGILKEFEKTRMKITTGATWKEGLSRMGTISKTMASLIKRGEKELELSKERNLQLDQEEEEKRKEDEEQLDNNDSDDIPDTDINYGHLDKRRKRNAKRRKDRVK